MEWSGSSQPRIFDTVYRASRITNLVRCLASYRSVSWRRESGDSIFQWLCAIATTRYAIAAGSTDTEKDSETRKVNQYSIPTLRNCADISPDFEDPRISQRTMAAPATPALPVIDPGWAGTHRCDQRLGKGILPSDRQTAASFMPQGWDQVTYHTLPGLAPEEFLYFGQKQQVRSLPMHCWIR